MSVTRPAFWGLIAAVCLAGLLGFGIAHWSEKRSLPNPGRFPARLEVAAGNFTLSVWNQSYEVPAADILVEINDKNTTGSEAQQLFELFHRTMPVENQHHVESAVFSFNPGTYELLVHELKTATVGVFTVKVVPGEPRGVLLMFWKDADNATSPAPHFTLRDVDRGFSIL